MLWTVDLAAGYDYGTWETVSVTVEAESQDSAIALARNEVYRLIPNLVFTALLYVGISEEEDEDEISEDSSSPME